MPKGETGSPISYPTCVFVATYLIKVVSRIYLLLFLHAIHFCPFDTHMQPADKKGHRVPHWVLNIAYVTTDILDVIPKTTLDKSCAVPEESPALKPDIPYVITTYKFRCTIELHQH